MINLFHNFSIRKNKKLNVFFKLKQIKNQTGFELVSHKNNEQEETSLIQLENHLNNQLTNKLTIRRQDEMRALPVKTLLSLIT